MLWRFAHSFLCGRNGAEWWLVGDLDVDRIADVPSWRWMGGFNRAGSCADIFFDSCLALYYAAPALALSDASGLQLDDLRAATYQVFDGGSCSCLGAITCQCGSQAQPVNGNQIFSAAIGEVVEQRSGWLTMTVPIALTPSTSYDVVVSGDGFYSRFVTIFSGVKGNFVVDLVMVPVVDFGQLRVVLTWVGQADLDLFVVAEAPIFTASPGFIWKREGKREMAGALIESSSTDAFLGAESALISFPPGQNETEFMIAVNVFGGYDGMMGKCASTDPTCSFRGGEEMIYVYSSMGLMWSGAYSSRYAPRLVLCHVSCCRELTLGLKWQPRCRMVDCRNRRRDLPRLDLQCARQGRAVLGPLFGFLPGALLQRVCVCVDRRDRSFDLGAQRCLVHGLRRRGLRLPGTVGVRVLQARHARVGQPKAVWTCRPGRLEPRGVADHDRAVCAAFILQRL